jgi:hypothetical protein
MVCCLIQQFKFLNWNGLLSYSTNQTQKKILAQWIAWWMSKDQDYTEMLKIIASSTMSGTRKAMLQLTR